MITLLIALACILFGATVFSSTGKAITTNLVSGLGGTPPKFVGWGTGAGTSNVSDTSLFNESADETRATGTVSRVTTTVTSDTLQVVGTMTVATNAKTITNVGLFDALTTGNIFMKGDFVGLSLQVGDSITFTMRLTYS